MNVRDVVEGGDGGADVAADPFVDPGAGDTGGGLTQRSSAKDILGSAGITFPGKSSGISLFVFNSAILIAILKLLFSKHTKVLILKLIKILMPPKGQLHQNL